MVYLRGIIMGYESCVIVTMQVLELLLESGWELSSKDNLNECCIRLNDEGFIEEEKQRFNGSFSYGVEKVAVSPLYILRMLFDGDEGKKDIVTIFAKEVPEYKFNGAISYVELVKMIEAMINNYYCNGGEIEDINYFKFRKKYINWKRDSYLSIKNQVLSISGMKYEDLVNLKLTKRGLARKIERMYQVEKLLRDYCYKIILDRKGIADVYIDDLYEYEDECAKIDLSRESISWEDFCIYIRELNLNEIYSVNQEYFEESKYDYNRKNTVLGLDLLALPAAPISKKAFERR